MSSILSLRSLGENPLIRLALPLLLSIALMAPARAQKPLIVGKKDFLEQTILCEVIREHLHARLGVEVKCSESLANPDKKVRDGEIDLYVEYAGTAYTEILKHTQQEAQGNGPDLTKAIRMDYKKRGLLWLDGLGFADTFVMVIRREDARRVMSNKLSDAKKMRDSWRLGAGPDFQVRADGLGQLVETYGFKLRGRPETAEVDALFQLLQSHGVDMIAANSTDPLIDDESVLQLADDKDYFPNYSAAIVLSEETTKKYPKIESVLQELSGKISLTEMRRMIDQVKKDNHPGSVEETAAKFLKGLSLR